MPPRYLAAVQRGLRASEGTRRRVAMLVPLAEWLRFGDHRMQTHPTLRLFPSAQFESFDVHQWIRFAREPDFDLQRLIDDVAEYLVGPRASLMLRRAASIIRRERWELDERATTLGQLLLGARKYVSLPDRAWLEQEVRMLFDHASAVERQLDDELRASIVTTVQRVVQRAPADSACVMPWRAWLAVAMVRYRAGQLAFLQRHASGVFTEADLGQSTERIVTKKEIRDLDRVGWAGMMVSATSEDGTGAYGVVDRRWFSPGWFAHLVHGTKDRSHVSRRLWRWLPSERCLIGVALEFVRQLGGEVILDSERTRWCSLPPDLEALIPMLSGNERALVSFDHDDDLETSAVDLHCGDPETAVSLSGRTAETLAAHHAFVETTIARGGLHIVGALRELYDGDTLTMLCDDILRARAGDPSAVSAVIDVLHDNDAPPPAALCTLANDPMLDPDLFEIAFTFLVKHRVHPESVARRLRTFCGLHAGEGAGAWTTDPPRDSDVLRFALALDPEAGRVLARAYLANCDEDNVMHASLELASIGTPWAIELLRDARATSYHPECIDAELAGVDTAQVQIQEGERDRDAERRAYGRMVINNSLDDDLLAVLYSGLAPTLD